MLGTEAHVCTMDAHAVDQYLYAVKSIAPVNQSAADQVFTTEYESSHEEKDIGLLDMKMADR